MSFDVTTLALAKSYTDQHGGSGGGESTIYIPVTISSPGDPPTIETSTTIEQIDIAYRSGQELMLKLFVDDSGENVYLLPLVMATPGEAYYFEKLISDQGVLIVARDTGWRYVTVDLIDHTHNNKSVLDKLSDVGGKLQYNGSDILTKSDKEEIVNDVLAALPTWTGGSY